MTLHLMISGQKYEFFIARVKKTGLNTGEAINGMTSTRNTRPKKKSGHDFCLPKKDKELYSCTTYAV